MSHFRTNLRIAASAEKIYEALTTQEGFQGWWTQDCHVPQKLGETIRICFGTTYKDLQIEKLEKDREVQWLCTKAHLDVEQIVRKDEWVGTRMRFRLTAQGATTQLDFEHIGLNPTFECFDLCSNGWTQFLGSLQQFVETGTGTPFEVTKQSEMVGTGPNVD